MFEIKVKNYTKEIRISMACYWIEYISQYNFSDLIIVIIIIIIIFLLFTLSSIYSTNASGAEQMPETSNSRGLRIPAGFLQAWLRI